MWHQGRWLGGCLEAFKVRNDGIVVDDRVIVREWSLVGALLPHDSTDVAKSLIGGHSLAIKDIIQALIAVVRNTKLSLALATASWATLIRIPAKDLKRLFFVV